MGQECIVVQETYFTILQTHVVLLKPQEKLEDTKGQIIRRKQNDRQYNSQKKNVKDNGQKNTTQKTND